MKDQTELHQLSVQYQPVSELKANPRNARTHSPRQVAQIKASIQAFGFTNPILADETGVIIAGHGRLEAATALGLKEVHGMCDDQQPGAVSPVQRVACIVGSAGYACRGRMASQYRRLGICGEPSLSGVP